MSDLIDEVKGTAHIDQWAMQIGGTILPFAAPELNQYVLTGHVTDHHELGTQKFIITSHIIELIVEEGQCETRNTIYTLGVPAADYIEHCRKIESPSLDALLILAEQENTP